MNYSMKFGILEFNNYESLFNNKSFISNEIWWNFYSFLLTLENGEKDSDIIGAMNHFTNINFFS